MSRYFTKTLASLEPYTPGEQLKIADIVKLNANENPYPPAPGVAAAVAAGGCRGNVVVRGSECVNKSYPDFWRDLDGLKGAEA